MVPARWRLVALAVCCLTVIGAVAKQQPHIKAGSAAVTALGADAARVAEAVGLSRAGLRRHLVESRDLRYDAKHKHLLYLCSGMQPDPTKGATAAAARSHSHSGHGTARIRARARTMLQGGAGADPAAADPAPSEAFRLHSRPGAPYTLLLDFTGHTTTNTSWNSGWGLDAIITPPYDTDGDGATFSDSERADIIAVWRAVAEDYAAFDIDVTTEETDAAGLPVDLTGRGSRAVVGGAAADWLGQPAGGVAYIGSFGDPSGQPAFVFAQDLSNYPKHVWEAASHELGHTFGLLHDGQGGNEYYEGADGWAPIMGVGYYQPLTQFSKGEYANATQTQDDLQVIRDALGGNATCCPADDHGNDTASATPLPGPGAAVSGAIERSGDVDVFSFSAAAGPLTLTLGLQPDWAGWLRADLDARLTLWSRCSATNSSASSLASWDTSGGVLAGSFSARLPAQDRYFVAVAGVGDPAGWPAFASLGRYSLSASYTPAAAGFSPAGPCPSSSAQLLAIKRAAGGVVASGKYRYASLTLRAANPATGAALALRSTAAITVSWQVTGLAGTSNSTADIAAGASSGSTTSPRTAAKSPSFRYTILAVDGGAGYAWDTAASDVIYTFT
ncbi:hypothetical protein ABPG75_012443 [Micractinium tetrahymenae]